MQIYAIKLSIPRWERSPRHGAPRLRAARMGGLPRDHDLLSEFWNLNTSLGEGQYRSAACSQRELEEQGDMFIFLLALLAIFMNGPRWHKRNMYDLCNSK